MWSEKNIWRTFHIYPNNNIGSTIICHSTSLKRIVKKQRWCAHRVLHCYRSLRGYGSVVVAASCKYRKAKTWGWQKVAGPGGLPAPSPAPVCSPRFFGGCQIKMRHVERRAPVGWSIARYVSENPEGLLRLSDMCQKSPGLESCQLRLKPRRAPGCQLRLQLQALHTEVDRYAPRALIYCWVCQMYATGGEIRAPECATHYELQMNQQRFLLASQNKKLSNICWFQLLKCEDLLLFFCCLWVSDCWSYLKGIILLPLNLLYSLLNCAQIKYSRVLTLFS